MVLRLHFLIKLTRLSTPVTCGLRARWNEIIRGLIEQILETEHVGWGEKV